MNLQKLILTENACYKAGRKITVKGIMVHSTGANNPWLKRYVGPDDGKLGKNQYNNHWNTYHPGGREVCVHGFIGKLADGSVATYQTLPWDHRGWHAGGSANNTHIGFEICEDGLTDATYFKKVYQEAIDLCVYLCKEYYDISNSVRQPSRSKPVSKTAFSAFNLDGYQVVRSQFLQLRYEGPVINISNERISFNKFCVQKFDRIAYIQLLLHPAERRIAIRPCRKADAHSIRWRPDPEKPVYTKTLNCQHFGNALYSIMNWNPDYSYKIRGTWASRGSEQIIVFNLPNAVPATLLPCEDGDASKGKRRVELCPAEWDGEFGDGFYEHALDNGFYYIAPNTEWNSQARSILAPGMEQFSPASPEQIQLSIENLMRGNGTEDGEPT